MSSQSLSRVMEYHGRIGRIGLNGTKDVVYDNVRSDAEKTILGVVDESGGQKKFKHIVIEYRYYCSHLLSTPCETNSEGESTARDVLQIGNELLEGMYGVYRVYPELVSAALRFGIEHELSHIRGTYSDGNKIIKKYVERAIRKRGPPKKDEMELFVLTEGFLNVECWAECEYRANLQAMTNRFKEPGMSFEKLEDEVAAMVWLIAENGYNAEPFRNIDDAELACLNYLEKGFPRLGNEFKEQIIEKIFGIDKEYRRRCELSFGHAAGRTGK